MLVAVGPHRPSAPYAHYVWSHDAIHPTFISAHGHLNTTPNTLLIIFLLTYFTVTAAVAESLLPVVGHYLYLNISV